MSRNNVRGPTSALTEFLRASGITPTTIAQRVAAQDQDQNQPATVQSNARRNGVAESSASARSTRRRSTRASGYSSDQLDEPEDAVEDEQNDTASSPKKRKLTKAAEAKLKAKAKGKGKGKGKKEDDSDYEEEEDPYNALSKSLWSGNGASSAKPPAGSFEDCAVCGKQFTVTRYTMASKNGSGFLCHTCAKASGSDPFKKPAPPKRKMPSEKRNLNNFEERRFPTLVSLCITLVTKHIDGVEALGNIGTMNVEAISKALSKNRGLTPDNALLFYNTFNTTLTLFDATNLTSPALETLARLNPNLTSLRLDFCGHLDDTSFSIFTTCLPKLLRLELLGPFLVRTQAWQVFFESHPSLEELLITQSPRFDLDCVKVMVKHCSGLKALRLKEIGKIDDSFLTEIRKLRSLKHLDLSDPSTSCSEEAMIDLLEAAGGSLTHLDLSNHSDLTDHFLNDGLGPSTTLLETLYLNGLPDISDTGVSSFFEAWVSNPPLIRLELSRNHSLGNKALQSILKHSGKQLKELDINSWTIDGPTLRLVGLHAPELKKVDVGFCREMDDFILKSWFEGEETGGKIRGGCQNLQEIKVWGCNKISERCPRRRGVSVYGVESRVAR